VVSWHAERAWVGARLEPDVRLEVEGDRFTSVEPGGSPDGTTRLPGVTLPGLANGHSHAFHRALRGRTHAGAGDFWAWRDQMYTVAERLDPDRYHRLARACFAEMALAGITVVGEFHYLHHQPGGTPYGDPNEMAEALRAAAAEAGIRLTLLDTLYLRSGFGGEPLDPAQARFSDGDAERWASRTDELATLWKDRPDARWGVAVHSVRAVDPESMRVVAALATHRTVPLHVHLSEQPAENEACRLAHGCTPSQLLADHDVLGPLTTAVHATHVTADDLDLLDSHGCVVCLCPTTERDLADGIGPARTMAERGIPLVLGSDSHAVIDLFEEARAVELDERLASGTRGGLPPAALLAALTEDGTEALGWPDAGRLEAGALADFVTVDMDSVRLAGADPGDLGAAIVFAATAADVREVVVGGRQVVSGGRHLLVEHPTADLAEAIAGVYAEEP
jgi:formiminoglutamate deiminase